jgi:glycine cleavage system H protein
MLLGVMAEKRPKDLKYTETHEWARVSGKEITVGITDYAVEQLGDITHIDLPKVGTATEEGEAFGEIDSVKTTADLVCPVTGKVSQINEEILKNLDLLKEDPYEDGWLIKVKVKDTAQLEGLMSVKDYEKYLESESSEEEEGGDDEEISDEDFA